MIPGAGAGAGAVIFIAALFVAADAKTCPPCGTTAVPFPLSTHPSCGDPSYKITCITSPATTTAAAAGTLLFQALNGTTYPITSINPSSQRLIISPAPLVSPETCTTTDLPDQGLLLDPSLPFNVTSSNTVMMLNCTKLLLFSPLNCSAASPCHAYVAATPAAAACRSAPLCCTFVAGGGSTSYAIRLLPSSCSAYASFVHLDTAAVPAGEWGKRSGVELQWGSPREPVCGSQVDCEDGVNATCSPDPSSGGGAGGGAVVRRCFCVKGLRWDPFTGSCVDATRCQPGQDDGCDQSTNHAPLIAGLVSGVVVAAAAGAAAYLFYRRQRRNREAMERLAKEREDILNLNNTSGRSAKNFTGRDIKKATSGFSRENLLGSGGYGDVYRGTLSDGTLVAVKCAKLGITKSTDQVLNEVRILSQVNHRALVRLLGCCVELEQPIMVYEFIPNGTLSDHLHGPGAAASSRRLLTWQHRLSIAHQTAEGLAYLHFSAVPPIYHRDVKTSNILLDEKLNAKVSDFGLSRLAVPDISHISTCAQGTLGYLDPEYYRNYQLTEKSDVYSFGVVLLELLTAAKAIDFCREADDVNLAVYVARKVEAERVMDVVDPVLKEGAAGSQVELDTMKALGFLAMGCLEERRQNRPSMKEVVEEIEYIMSILNGGSVDGGGGGGCRSFELQHLSGSSTT